jgi:hypothetical protein
MQVLLKENCLEGVDRYIRLFQSRVDGALPSRGSTFALSYSGEYP